MSDKGFFEIDLVEANITWTNAFTLQKLGLTSEQVRSMTMFDIVPVDLHDPIRDHLEDHASGKPKKFAIWPVKTSTGKISWWYIFDSKVEFPISWSCAEFVQETDVDGPAYTFMRITMMNANSYGTLHNRVQELDSWIHDQVSRLDEKDADHDKALSELSERMKHVVNAATRAASTSLEAASAVKDLKESLKEQLEKHEEEILKLISTDVHHDRRMEAFEKHVKTTTDVAIKSITTQADKAGKGLSRKVTIPVSTIAAIATIIQWLIQHFLK